MQPYLFEQTLKEKECSGQSVMNAKSSNDDYVAADKTKSFLREIALHIAHYMTVLYLFNNRTSIRNMDSLLLRQIPLSTIVIG